MSTIIYKRIAEVQVLHDYFLTTSDSVSFFDKNKENKSQFLLDQLGSGRYNSNDFVDLTLSEQSKKYLEQYKIVVLPSSLGFIIAIEVEAVIQSGKTMYRPKVQVDENTNLLFELRSIGFFRSITNVSIKSALPAHYYFTNKGKAPLTETVVPAYESLPLSQPVIGFDSGRNYQMGAIAIVKNKIQEANRNTSSNNDNHWDDIPDRRWVTDADKVLLPQQFVYHLEGVNNVKKVRLILEDEANQKVKTIIKEESRAFDSVFVDFLKQDEADGGDIIPEGWYKLRVKVQNKAFVNYQVYLKPELYEATNLAMIDLRFDELDSPYSLLDKDGFLKTHILANGTKIPHPVFEIRLKNRKTYWRYKKEGTFSQTEIDSTSQHLKVQSDALVSRKPKALTAVLTQFHNGSSLTLPNPEQSSMKVEEDKVYSDIFIHQSNRLLNN